MAIIVPNGVLNNAPLGYVRQWITDNAQVLGVVDMQRDLFQPKNDTQTSMVFLRRLDREQRTGARDYPIFMAVTDRIGHDKRGNPVYKRDIDGNDVIVSRASRVKLFENGHLTEQEIEEFGPVVDDQLADIPGLYRAWALENGQ